MTFVFGRAFYEVVVTNTRRISVDLMTSYDWAHKGQPLRSEDRTVFAVLHDMISSNLFS